MKVKYYLHTPSQRMCHKETYFEQEYIVFNDTRQMKTVTKEGLYSKFTLRELHDEN